MSIVYMHTNLLTGRSYVGISVSKSWRRRWGEHVRAARWGIK